MILLKSLIALNKDTSSQDVGSLMKFCHLSNIPFGTSVGKKAIRCPSISTAVALGLWFLSWYTQHEIKQLTF